MDIDKLVGHLKENDWNYKKAFSASIADAMYFRAVHILASCVKRNEKQPDSFSAARVQAKILNGMGIAADPDIMHSEAVVMAEFDIPLYLDETGWRFW